MEWGEVAQRIYSTLKENDYGYLVDQMVHEYGIGGTPGEMFSIVCHWLAGLRNTGNPAFEFVREDAERLFRMGYDLNYFTKDSLSKI